jgi:DNA polymerase-3 subunit epsilon
MLNSVDVIAGQNIFGFDLKILYLELIRAGINFDLQSKMFYDTKLVERNIAPRTLGAMYKRYTGNDLTDAHQAIVDTEACFEVFKHQYKKAVDAGLAEDVIYTKTGIDLFNYVKEKDGKLVFNFGKNFGRPVVENVDYAIWVLQSAFPPTTKKAIKDELRNAGYDVK